MQPDSFAKRHSSVLRRLGLSSTFSRGFVGPWGWGGEAGGSPFGSAWQVCYALVDGPSAASGARGICYGVARARPVRIWSVAIWVNVSSCIAP